MKNFIFSLLFVAAFVTGAIGQTTVVDFETVSDPLVEPFNLTAYYNGVANPDGTGLVGQAVKDGSAFWGGINIYFGGDIDLSGTGDVFTIDFYTEDAGVNDSILFKFQLFNRYGGSETVEVDAFYSDANDPTVGAWKTLTFAIPDDVSGSYNKMVIFFGWEWSNDGDVYYYDNIVAPGYNAYGNTDVTFSITDKFNNSNNLQLFVDGTEATLTQTDNVYTATESLASYNVTVGQDQGIYEVVYSYDAFGETMRDTASVIVGNTSGAQEITKIIILEEQEDGTGFAIDVDGTAPVIDGVIDDVWSNAKMHALQQGSWWGSQTPLYSYYKVMWDIYNVYILNYVEDATPQNGGANPWDNDNIELFFDMNQSASDGFDSDDWQIRCVRGLDTWTGSANVDDTWAADVERAQAEMADNACYIIEWAIPWTSLSNSFLPLSGTEFNFDVIAADDVDGAGGRDYLISWATTADQNYYNTALYGTITLSDMTNEVAINEVAPVPGLSVYPNPVVNQLYVQAANPIKDVVIYDVVGRETTNINNLDSKTVTLNVSDLNSSAIYIVKIIDNEGNISSRKITVK
ncbi:MAG: hypothetical protein C0599_00455 [Salinivirgaceae bacterium]|nr:MAG: hypothetical protein C0599_00455 [Salinivirgaceae bacterium]